jgi:2TM domain
MDDEIITPGMSEREIYIRRRVKRLAEFYRHLAMYVIVISIVWIVSFIAAKEIPTSIWRFWAIWPTIGWGIGVIAHGLSVLPNYGFFSLDWEEKKVREIMSREQGGKQS